MRILVAVDGSDQSLHAVRAVEHLAHAEKVVMLHALDVPTLAYPMYHTMGVPRTLEVLSLSIEQAMREDGKRLLDRVVSLLLMNGGSVVKKLKKGLPGEVILTTAEKVKTDLIVLGSRGLGPIKELLVGNVSHCVVMHAPCQTLVVNRLFRSPVANRNSPRGCNHGALEPSRRGLDPSKRLIEFVMFKMRSFRALRVSPVWHSPCCPNAARPHDMEEAQ
jgi:nucleotide-binding universal stress UspA family protein